VGKTSLIYQYINNYFPENYISTVGIDFKEKSLSIGNKNIRLQIWDTAGQERFHTITKAYYRGAHGLVIVFDITNPESFHNVSYWLQNIEESCDKQHEKIMVGNKSDLSEDRKVSAEQIAAMCEQHNIKYIEASSKTGSNVEEAFLTLTEFVMAHQN
jgi:small GTP-binding protein